MTERQEPKPTTRRDAEWAVFARATELAEVVAKRQKRGEMTHITEVRLIEALDDLRPFHGSNG